MSEAAKTGGGSSGGMFSGANTVHEQIKKFQAAKATGKFTFQAGRADRILNLAIGVGMCVVMFNVSRGVHQLANGYGRKEGF
ncbi:hypothetical protein BWQ96_00958 [Gracilariopsis chorda]|uniref:Uncharacterized protein n=1 Tax=Gracilariopsis chorda TaxID=448386 RepID=A0A2V3J463_9FLOR|nr:hypothetical protein BWQ96_00958 [Gracilariopsis chorda]|eukprot:PXF49169.1 hypothetical protein BWQ96_00958 [Gracilariopsis chorda]